MTWEPTDRAIWRHPETGLECEVLLVERGVLGEPVRWYVRETRNAGFFVREADLRRLGEEGQK